MSAAGQLDLIFPYVCFFYGVVMTLALNVPALSRLAEERLPPAMAQRWRAHQGLGYLCLFVGAGWILQNLWFT